MAQNPACKLYQSFTSQCHHSREMLLNTNCSLSTTKSDKLQVWTKENSLAPAITQHSQKCSVLQTSAGYLESKVKVQADAELTLTKIVISEMTIFVNVSLKKKKQNQQFI